VVPELADARACREQLEQDLREALQMEAETGDAVLGALLACGFLKQSLINAIIALGGPDLNELVSADLGMPGWRPPSNPLRRPDRDNGRGA
jgi:hypothetical protein